jgi:glycosyltransferase involved in cell wall biosynthesis
MHVLFVHNNFPAQFRHVARTLAADPSVRVTAIGSPTSRPLKGVKLLKYSVTDTDVAATHPFARRFDLECRRAEQVLYALSSLARSGSTPDVIVAHCGWGEALPLRAIFPKARLLIYCEFYYGRQGRDVGFDPEFPEMGADGEVGLHLKNASTLLALAECDEGIAPTHWQRSTYPELLRSKIKVQHEGVDTDIAKPAPTAAFRLPSGRTLRGTDEIITFAARNLEPLRGYHMFMRALPRVMRERPRAEILVLGGHGTTYGAPPSGEESWGRKFFMEVEDQVDARRIHFTGHLPYDDYLRALQVSSAHVYFTYPFVLSWSLLEAMSCECLVIGSDTAPVREIIQHRENGLLAPFFDNGRLVELLVDALANRGRYRDIRHRARRTVVEHFDLQRVCLPDTLAWIRGGAQRPPSEAPAQVSAHAAGMPEAAVS